MFIVRATRKLEGSLGSPLLWNFRFFYRAWSAGSSKTPSCPVIIISRQKIKSFFWMTPFRWVKPTLPPQAVTASGHLFWFHCCSCMLDAIQRENSVSAALPFTQAPYYSVVFFQRAAYFYLPHFTRVDEEVSSVRFCTLMQRRLPLIHFVAWDVGDFFSTTNSITRYECISECVEESALYKPKKNIFTGIAGCSLSPWIAHLFVSVSAPTTAVQFCSTQTCLQPAQLSVLHIFLDMS